ncbi:MAG: branched-chain amino acid ABC transporter substrate-binding protein [Piscinibacter sp.]|nr:branched-chain amino acid ABC transporter substrate-binding protein [Piscinibacter sp.]
MSGIRGVTRRTMLVAGALASATLLGACSRTPDVIKIGVGQPLSGPLAALGRDLANGVQMAVDEINAAGGVSMNGKAVRLEVVTADDRSDPEAGVAAARQLAEAGVLVAVAHLNSGVSIPAAAVYAEAGIPQLAISTKPDYTRLGLPTTLRLVASDDLQSRALGSYATQMPGVERVAVVDDNTPYGKGLADSSAKVIAEAGRKITVRRSYDDKTTDFAALVQELKSTDTQLFVTTLSDFQVEALIEQLVRAGMAQMRILGGDTIKTDRMIKSAGRIAGVYATSSILEAREFMAGRGFLERFRARFKGEPVYGAHYAYDSVFVVADALSRNGSADKARLLQRLKTFDGNAPVTTTMRFAEDGEQRYAAIGVYRLGAALWEPLMRSDQW